MRPVATLGEYRGVEVGKADTEVPDESVDEEINRLREGFGSLNPVERAAAEGDVAMIDYRGTIDGEVFDGSEGRDFAIELGGEGLLEEFDAAVTGASAGDELEVEVNFPDDHQPEELAGKTATFAITVKEVREKELPELDDDFAQQASEFETTRELREEMRSRIGEALEQRAKTDFREAAVDAAADLRDRRAARRARARQGARDVGALRAPAHPAGRRPHPLRADAGQDARGDHPRGGGGRGRARCAARRPWPRSPRPRRSSRPTTTSPERLGRARAIPRPRRSSAACARPAATPCCARRSGCGWQPI